MPIRRFLPSVFLQSSLAKENLEFKTVDVESLTFGDLELASEFGGIFRDYFDFRSRDYSDHETSSESGSEKGKSA